MRRAAIWVFLLFALAVISVAQEHPEPAAHGEAAAHAEAGEHHEPDMTNWKWANFAILAAGLGFLLVKQAGPYFRERSIEIRKGIEDSQKLRAEAEAKAGEMDARLKNLGIEVEAMRKAAREEAANEGARIRQETERELAKIQTHADQEIANALKTAQIELKSYSAQLAVELARKKVQERMTPADQDSLVQSFTSNLGSKTS